ncbi:MAG: hypothetical protein RL748_2469 [Pseudomonadota bacterium]|jgi:hypothetical protein
MLTAPPKVSPLEHNGLRFQQDRHTRFDDREFAATYLSAIDIETDKVSWIIKICDCLRYPPSMEVLPVDFKSLTFGPNDNQLTIETTTTARYVVDLQGQTVTLVYDPDWTIKPYNPNWVEPVAESLYDMPPTTPRKRKK